MTSERRFERDLPDLLAQLALGPEPDYRDHIIRQTARMRQRRAWMFPERWLPMTAVTSRAAAAPWIAWRTVGLVALLLLALVAGALLIAGSQQRFPMPFGRAANGLVVYAADGDIFTTDPASGIDTLVVGGPETDVGPVWSRDGTHFAFERKVDGVAAEGRLYVARSDGSELIAVTAEPATYLTSYAFSPDGREILFASRIDGQSTISIAGRDGTGIRTLVAGLTATSPTYRPPDGAEIAFVGQDLSTRLFGLYAVRPDGSGLRRLLESSATFDLEWPEWSPDGSQIAYTSWDPRFAHPNGRIHVISADATGNRMIGHHPDATWEALPVWSNDGERVVVLRGYTVGYKDIYGVVLPADGSGLGVETKQPLMPVGGAGAIQVWAPDDTSILTMPVDRFGGALPQVLWDPVTGASTSTSWAATSKPAWQRKVP
jgi:Tol biopolymer transport system component